MKIHRFFTTVIYIRSKCQKHIIGLSMNMNVFSWLYPFSNWERESGKRNLGVKEKCPQSYLSFSTGFHWRIFFFHGLLDFVLFLVLAWGTLVSHVSVNLLSLARSKMAMVRLPRALLKNWLFCPLLPLRGREPHFRFGVPANHLASLSFPFRCPATWGHLSVNIWSIFSVTHIPS